MSPRFLICGGGNIPHSLAAALTRHEDVALLTRRPADWSSHMNGNPYAVLPTNDPRVAADAEIIFIVLPRFAIRETLEKIDPYLRADQTICFTPANDIIPELVDAYAKRGVDVACLQRVPYIARIEEYGRRVRLSPARARHMLYARDHALWREICRTYFEAPAEFLNSPLTFVFNNSNPLLHPARLVVLFRDWRKKTFTRNPLFYAEWTDESSELYIRADAEMHAVLKAADPTGACERDYESVLAHYGVSSAAELTSKLHAIEGFKLITSPMRELPDSTWLPDFTSRYFTEDIVGTRAIQTLARKFAIPTPTIDFLISQISALASLQ